MSEHFVLVSGYADSLINFRGDLIRDLIKADYRVTALAPEISAKQREAIRDLGAEPIQYYVQRNGLSAFDDLKTLNDLRFHFKSLKPDLVMAYTIKPVIWSGIALRRNPHVRFFPMITGLGYAFSGGSLKRRVLQALVKKMYKESLKRAERVIFQNEDSRQIFADSNIADKERSMVVSGSGINLSRFPRHELSPFPVTFLMLARLIGQKGVRTYVNAARELKREFPDARFQLAGPFDPSPDAISKQEMDSWVAEDAIEYLGNLEDVRPALAGTHVFVLPTVYREGLPRSLLEAMSVGRPLITTDSPGCRETIILGENGFLVEPGSLSSLVKAMRRCLENPDQLQRMGDASRAFAERRFSVDIVNQSILSALR